MVYSVEFRNPVLELELSSLYRHNLGTFVHSFRVASRSLTAGVEAGFSDEQLRILARAALGHDVGKRAISPRILGKRGELDERERTDMQLHARLGYKMLKETEPVSARIAVAHHEYSLDPYPRRDAVPAAVERRVHDPYIDLASQILAAADQADALLSDRPNRGRFSREDTLDILFGQFTGDPNIIPVVVNAPTKSDLLRRML